MIQLPTHRYCSSGKVEPIAMLSIYHLLAAFDHDVDIGCRLWFDVITSLYSVEEIREVPSAQFYTDILMIRALASQMGSMKCYKHSHNVWERVKQVMNVEIALADFYAYEENFRMATLPNPTKIDYVHRLYSNEGKYLI